MPTILAPGTWYLLAVADDQNQVDESDENNNSRPADTGPLTITAIPTAVPTCGTERWPVKTGSDADAKFINLGAATPTTIPSLASISPPADKPENNRIPPT